MVYHQTTDVDLPIGLAAAFVQGLRETLSITIVAKHPLAVGTAVQYLIECAGIFDAQLAGNGRTLASCLASVLGQRQPV